MLTKNLHQQVGLVKGIRGQVVEFVLADDAPPPNLPLYVVVKFRGYSGGELVVSGEILRVCADFSRRHYLAGQGSAGQDATAVEALLGQTSHWLYSTCGAPRNHAKQWPVGAHV